MLLVAFVLSSIQASYGMTESSFNSSSSGTTSATTFVPVGGQIAEVRDLSWRLDNSNTSGFIGQYIGQRKYAITSSTASAATVLFISNDSTGISAGEFVIFLDGSSGTYFLRRVSAATTTSITVAASIAVTTSTVDDYVWSCLPTVEKAVIANSQTGGMVSIWLPASVPAAFVIDGNTTSCRISISGYRGPRQ